MPLTKKGMMLLGKFKKDYGKKKGARVFYSWEHKHKDLVR